MRQTFLLAVIVPLALVHTWAQSPASTGGLAQRIAHTDPSTFRVAPAVHGGAGSMSFTALLNRGALTAEFNFLHRGVIPPGSGIGHHFHNVVEEMFVILDGEAQFTVDGRTASVKGPAGVLCRVGHSHAIYNPGPAPLQWMNLNVSLIAGVYDNFDLGDTRVGAALDAISTFMTIRFDRSLLRAAVAGRGAPVSPPAPNAVLSRRAAGPAMFSTTWSYVDHVLVPPGASTPDLPHDGVAEAYYVLGGDGTFTVAGGESGTAAVRAGDAIPVRIGETTRFTSSGSASLELIVMGVARDMAAKTPLLIGTPR
jgi:mannose-6-phosphate isomerase-like protein (cupin superfamily)